MTTRSAPPTSAPASREFARTAGALRQLVAELADTAPEAVREQIIGLRTGIAALCAQGNPDTAKRVLATMRAHPGQLAAAAVGARLLGWLLLSRRT